MRQQVMAAVLVAGLVAFAGPAWSQSRGGGHAGGGHASGGGHSWSGGHTGAGSQVTGVGHGSTSVQPRSGALHGGIGHPGGGGRYGWRGYHGRGGNYGWGGYYGWGDPFWWGAFWGWGWPFAWGGYYGPWYDEPGYYGSATPVAPANNLTPVRTYVSPEEALVYLNGVLIGTARDFDGESDVLYLGAGHYTVEFRLPGYHSRALKLDATGGEATIPIALELVPDHSGTLVAPYRPPQGLPYGRVFGPDFGRAMSQQEPRPAWGSRPGLRLESHPDAGAVAAPPPTTANPGLAALKLRISPPNAAVYLDGEFLSSGAELGRLQRGVAVLSGPHRIEVLAPGYAAKSVVIETEAGKELQVTVELEPAR